MNKQKPLETILILVLFQIILFWNSGRSIWLYTAFSLGIISVFVPFLAAKIHFIWMKFGHVMGYVVSRILLTAIFFLVLFPLSVLSKVFSKKSSVKATGNSYFKERNFSYTSASLENLW